MKRYTCYIPLIVFLLYSCSQDRQGGSGDLFEIAVDTNRENVLPLSEIAEKITAVEMEMTDESLINPEFITRFIITENNIILFAMNFGSPSQVLVFNKDGKFVRSIGSKGQGPREFNMIKNVAFDEKSKRIFILSGGPSKIICYHLDGTFIKESRLSCDFSMDLNYINNELFLYYEQTDKHTKSILLRMNENFQITDSCIIRDNYYEKGYISMFFSKDYIVKNNTSIYFYSPEVYPKWLAPEVKVLRDTLYRIEDNHLVPELKLKFKNDGFDSVGDKIIDLYNIFRSSRYVFAIYQINPNNTQRVLEHPKIFFFCYDTKTGKSYNMQDGFTDDINGIEKRVSIRPLHTNSEIFYYWHTNMKPDDPEEPNPTLYIIKLKK